MRTSTIIVAVLLVAGGATPGVVMADFFENFEDGNYTSNPTWAVTNHVGSALIAADPLRSNNMVLKSKGTATAEEVLEASLTESVPWEGFDFSVQFRSSTDWYHPYFLVYGSDYGLKFELLRSYAAQNIRFRISETGTSSHDSSINIPSPIADWWGLHLWHDVDTGYVNAEIRLVADNSLLVAQSFMPTAQMAVAHDISGVEIEIGEPDWQYVDNLTITPEPATLSLLVLGGLAILKRRKGA